MNIERLRDDLESSIMTLLEENNLENIWTPYLFCKQEFMPENYNATLRSFKYLFAHGDNSRVYLWNRFFCNFDRFSTAKLDKDDFTAEELSFLEDIENTHKQVTEKYGEFYSADQNINSPIETPRLRLCPFSDQLAQEYVDYFAANRSEFESYYNMDFDRADLSLCKQQFRKLSFAVILKGTEQFVGSVALELKRCDVVYNVEYYLFPEFRKHGYAREAVSAIIEAARKSELLILKETIKSGVFDTIPANIKCIEALINTTNYPSIKLVKDLNFKQYGIIPYQHYYNGEYRDDYSFELLIEKETI